MRELLERSIWFAEMGRTVSCVDELKQALKLFNDCDIKEYGDEPHYRLVPDPHHMRD